MQDLQFTDFTFLDTMMNVVLSVGQTLENCFLFAPSDSCSKRGITERPFVINTPCREDDIRIASTLWNSQYFVFYTDGCLIDGRAGAGIYCEKLQVEHYVPLGSSFTILQA